MKNKVLVIGGAGFIGTNLIKRLLKEGYGVVSWDNYNTGLKSNHVEGAIYSNTDITTRKPHNSRYLEDFCAVYHLAAIARIQPSFENPVDYFQTNAFATMKIAKMCAEADLPLIYAGSSSHHSGKYKNPYTFSKTIGEEVLEMFKENFGL